MQDNISYININYVLTTICDSKLQITYTNKKISVQNKRWI